MIFSSMKVVDMRIITIHIVWLKINDILPLWPHSHAHAQQLNDVTEGRAMRATQRVGLIRNECMCLHSAVWKTRRERSREEMLQTAGSQITHMRLGSVDDALLSLI